MQRWIDETTARLSSDVRPGPVKVALGVVPTRVTPLPIGGVMVDRVFTAFCRITDPDGLSGSGYSMFLMRDDALKAALHGRALIGDGGASLAGLLRLELDDERDGAADDRIAHSAVNAISLAAWDLHARHRGVSCAALWGGTERPLACYDSTHLAFAALDEIDAAIDLLRSKHFTLAKMAVGGADLDYELARIAKAQAFLGPNRLAIDPVRRWTVEQVRQVLPRIAMPLMWLEDPVPYGDMAQLADVPGVAVGEISCNLAQLEDLARAGAEFLLPDLGCIGGPLRFLEAARQLEAHGVKVGSHAYPYHSLHLLSCLGAPLPAEVMNWGAELFVDLPEPDTNGRMIARGPGFGLAVNEGLLATSAEWVLPAA